MTRQTSSLPAEVVDDAIAWMVKLQSGQATSEDEAAWQQWRQSHPDHAQAWARLDDLGQRIRKLPAQLARATLSERHALAKRPSRRAVLKCAAWASGTAWIAFGVHDRTWRHLTASHRTGIGEQARIKLADGSTLQLNTATMLDERFDEHSRGIVLHQGEVVVHCTPDLDTPARPFVLHTAQGSVQTPTGRFRVRQWGSSTLVQVLEGAVEVRPRDVSVPSSLEAGRQLRFNRLECGSPEAADVAAGAWIDGVIVAKRMRLTDLVAELDRYRRGRLQCADTVAELRISGVFPVVDPDRAIAAIERTLPVRARACTRYWVTLQAA